MKSFRNTRWALALLLLPLAGCTRDHAFQPVDMWNNTRLKPYEAMDTPTGTNALPIPVGAVARGQLITAENELLETGKQDGKLATAFPFQVDENVLRRGQQRYTIFCSPCHGALGDGQGLIVNRGFSKPPDYLERRLVDAPVGHYFNVITHGHGAMYSYAARVPVPTPSCSKHATSSPRIPERCGANGRSPAVGFSSSSFQALASRLGRSCRSLGGRQPSFRIARRRSLR